MPIPPRGYPGVFLAYASQKGTAFIDRTLYLPRAWTQGAERRVEAGIPEEIRFASKITLAERMLARAFDAGVPARWVVADSFYGRSHAFRRWLEGREIAYAVMIPKTNAVEYQRQRLRAEQLGERLSAAAGRPAWACLALSEECVEGMGRWLLVRYDADDPSEDAYWLVYGPEGTSDEELARVCNTRWQVEEGIAQMNGFPRPIVANRLSFRANAAIRSRSRMLVLACCESLFMACGILS